MDLATAQNTFAIRLYDWSLLDFSREINDGCPLLSSVGLNNRHVAAVVAWLNEVPFEQREFLARALVWQAHKYAAKLRGEAMSEAEEKGWNKEFYQEVTNRMRHLPPLATANCNVPGFKPVDPAQCLQALYSSLSPMLGEPTRRKSGVRVTKKIGDWELISEFTFYRRDRELRLEYQFVRKDGRPIIGHESPFPRNPFWFYGVSDTNVAVPSQADSEAMAKVMARLAEHFVSQADALFSGLGISDN
jgi:hypothetical protein